jgi:ABC-type phosphate transport system substrate-binding protein
LIYLNQITMWNDQRIKDLNPAATAAALPNAPIVVITSSVASDLTQLFTTVLARTVPAFEAAVVPGPSATFPVQGAGSSRSIIVDSPEEMISTLSATSNAFCFANGYDITLVRAYTVCCMSSVPVRAIAQLLTLTVAHRHEPSERPRW